VKRRCVPSMNSHVIVREANDLTDCAVQRHGASPQHGVSWTHAASLHENHVIVSPSLRSRVNSANDLTDSAMPGGALHAGVGMLWVSIATRCAREYAAVQ
jgi:hypothetical protein